MNKKELSQYFQKLGRKGAKTRMTKTSPEQRKRIAQAAAKSRWAQRKNRGAA